VRYFSFNYRCGDCGDGVGRSHQWRRNRFCMSFPYSQKPFGTTKPALGTLGTGQKKKKKPAKTNPRTNKKTQKHKKKNQKKKKTNPNKKKKKTTRKKKKSNKKTKKIKKTKKHKNFEGGCLPFLISWIQPQHRVPPVCRRPAHTHSALDIIDKNPHKKRRYQ